MGGLIESTDRLLPMWNGAIRERTVKGDLVSSMPFVEVAIWWTPQPRRRPASVSSEIQIGVYDFTNDRRYDGTLMGRAIANYQDVLAAYRGLHIIDSLDRIDDPYSLSSQVNLIADSVWYRYNRRNNPRSVELLVKKVGEDRLKAIHGMIPPNLESVVTFLLENRAKLDASSLIEEIKRGRITVSDIYNGIIAETEDAIVRTRDIRRAEI